MNWEAIGAIGEILGAAGVIVTLAFLARQLMLNTQSIRVNTIADYFIASTDLNLESVRNPELRRIMEIASKGDEMTFQDEALAFGFIQGMMNMFQTVHVQFDLVDSELRLAVSQRLERVATDSFPNVFDTYWNRRKSEFTPAFQQYVDGILDALD